MGNYISAFEGFKDIKSADELKEKFQSANITIEETRKSIQNLSQASTDFAAKGENLKNEVTILAATFRQAAQSGLPIDQQSQLLEELKSKIQDYGTMMIESSAAAQAAYELQKESVVSLETELSNLQIALQNAVAEGNTASADVLAQQIATVNTELKTAQEALVNLSATADRAKESLSMVAEEQNKMTQDVGRGSSFLGNIIDLSRIAKEELKELFRPVTDAMSSFSESAKEKIGAIGESISNTFSNLSQKIGLDILGEKISEYTSKITNAATGNGKFQQSLSAFKNSLDQLPIPLGKGLNGIVAMTKALWSMAATPIGAVLTAIVLALQSLGAWLTKDAEGQRVFAKASAYLGSILSTITDIAVTIGKYLFHAFADAGAPMNAYAKGLKTTFVSAIRTVSELVSGLGKTLKGIFTMDWDTFKNGVSEMGQGLLDAGKTIVAAVETNIKGFVGAVKLIGDTVTNETLGKELGKHWDNMLPKAEESAKLAERELNARIEASKAQEKAAKLDSEIAKKREEIYTLTGKAKDVAIEETKALMKAKYDDQIKVQKEQLDIQREKNSLHVSSLEDLAKERELNIQLLRTEAQREASTRMLTRMQQSNLNKMRTSAKGDLKTADTINSAEAKLDEIVRKNANERAQATLDMEDKLVEARIKAMEEGAKKIEAERERANKKELEQIEEQRKAAIEAERKRQKSEFDAEQAIVKARGGKITQWDDSMLDKSTIDNINKQFNEIANNIIKSQEQEIYKAELTAMRDYLKEYGTYQQQKLAIAEEYAEKIRNAQTEGERLTLTKERDKALQGKEDERIISKVDWVSAFGNLGNAFESVIKNTLAELNAYIQTDDFRNRSAEDKKTILEAQSNLQGKVGSDATFAKLNKQLDEYRGHVQSLQNAESLHKAAIESLTEAERQRDGISDRLSEEYSEASRKVIEAQAEQERTAQLVIDADNSVAESQSAVSRTAKELQSNLDKFSAGLNGLTSGTLSGTVDGLTNLLQSLGSQTKVVDKFNDFLKTGLSAVFGEQIGGFMAESLDIVEGVLTGEMSETIISGVLGMLDKILDGVLSGDIITKPVMALTQGLDSIADTLGFDMNLSGLLGGDYSKWNDALEYWGGRLEVWGEAVDRYTSEISEGYGAESYEAAKKAQYYNEQSIKGQEQLLNARLDSGAGLFSHSIKQRMWDGSYKGDGGRTWKTVAQAISQEYGKEFTSMRSLYNFTPDELRQIKADYVDLWNVMDGKFRDGLEELIEMKENADEIRDVLNEALTGVSFDSFRDSFFDMLSDMDKGVDELTSSFEDSLNKSILNSLLSNKFNDRLKALYEQWAGIFDEDGNVDKSLAASAKETQAQLAQDMVNFRDTMAKQLGIESSSTSSTYQQESTKKAYEGLSEDTGNEINGRLTALQINTDEIRNQSVMQTMSLNEFKGSLSQISLSLTGISNIADDARTIIANSYLELQEINENTGISAKYLKDIKSDIAEVKKSVSRI